MFVLSGIIGILSDIIKGYTPYNFELAGLMFIKGIAIFLMSILCAFVYCLFYRIKNKKKCFEFRKVFIFGIVILSALYLWQSFSN